MFGWHHWFFRNELGQTPGDGEGQRSLVCCSPCSREVRQHKQIPSLAHSTPRERSKELQNRQNLVWWGQEKTTSREIAITWIRKMCALWVRIRKPSHSFSKIDRAEPGAPSLVSGARPILGNPSALSGLLEIPLLGCSHMVLLPDRTGVCVFTRQPSQFTHNRLWWRKAQCLLRGQARSTAVQDQKIWTPWWFRQKNF